MLLELAELQPTRPFNGGAPILSQEELVATLASVDQLTTLCSQLTNTARNQVDTHPKITSAARGALHQLIDAGTALAVFRVRFQQAVGQLPVSLWQAGLRSGLPLRLGPSASAAELWEAAVRHHLPCVVGAGAFTPLVQHCSAENLARLYGERRVRARQVYEQQGASGDRRIFVDSPSESDTVAFGAWCLSAASGEPTSRDVYPAKLALREALPGLANHLDAAHTETPLSRFGACVGAMAEEGAFMYAGAGANTTQTHFDPAENFLLVAKGSKTLQLFAPSDAARLYPSPNPTYHSCEVKAFTSPADAPRSLPAYRSASPISALVEEGEMLYLPAYWYHGVTGGDGFNVLLAWWSAIHPNKHDGGSGLFEPVRPNYAPLQVQPQD